MKLSTTLLLTPKANFKANQGKHANVLGLHKQGRKVDMNFRNAYQELYPSKKHDI
jgi:hypothetical protein